MENLKEKATKVIKKFKEIYGEPKTMLNYNTPFELMVAVVLSAQCTDKRVNIVTEELFAKYNTPKDFAHIDIEILENFIKSTGFYKNKAKNIKSASIKLLENFNGEVPNTIEKLITLDGVGRKSANVILGHIYDIKEGVVVDTHVKRLSNRIGFTQSQNPEIIERDLMKIFDKDDWFILSNLMIMHGRAVCKARKPLCNNCEIKQLCEMGREKNER